MSANENETGKKEEISGIPLVVYGSSCYIDVVTCEGNMETVILVNYEASEQYPTAGEAMQMVVLELITQYGLSPAITFSDTAVCVWDTSAFADNSMKLILPRDPQTDRVTRTFAFFDESGEFKIRKTFEKQ